MIIQYKIEDVKDGSIVPFTPMYRRKLKGFYCIFQFLFPWYLFPQVSSRGEIECHVRYSNIKEAAEFLESVSIDGPCKWEQDIKELSEKIKRTSSFEYESYIHFEKEYK